MGVAGRVRESECEKERKKEKKPDGAAVSHCYYWLSSMEGWFCTDNDGDGYIMVRRITGMVII